MRLFGLTIARTKSLVAATKKALSPVLENRGWYRIFESFAGAWQTNVVVDRDLVLSYHAVYACISLIAGDVAKLRLKLVEKRGGVWQEIESPINPVFTKPNSYQTRQQFFESWVISKLVRGNTYVLLERDAGGRVVALYVLDPSRVKVLIADDGSVFYELSQDQLNGLDKPTVIVPAREIIHDRADCLYHPLIGTSPIFAAGLAATQGLNIQTNSANFFSNRSMPGGILTADGAISDETATRLKSAWDSNYSGTNAGKVAVLGDGLKFQALTVTAEDAQLIEQLRWTAEVVCGVFHVPPFMAGVGPEPNYNNVQALTLRYYSQCLQKLLEAIESCLDIGLGLGAGIGVEFDLDGLLRMDSVTQVAALKESVGAGIRSPNEARAKLDLAPVEGGEGPYLQQQNFSLAALAKRDSKPDPFGKSEAAAPAPPSEQARSILKAADWDAARALLEVA